MKISPQYLAGVADSDGSFTYGKKWSGQRGKHYFAGQFQITWKKTPESVDFFEALVEKYGGSYFGDKTTKTYNRNGTDIIKYCATGEAVVKICKDVLPYLILKPERAQIVLDGAKLKEGNWGVKGKPQHIWDEEDRLYQLMKQQHGKEKTCYSLGR